MPNKLDIEVYAHSPLAEWIGCLFIRVRRFSLSKAVPVNGRVQVVFGETLFLKIIPDFCESLPRR